MNPGPWKESPNLETEEPAVITRARNGDRRAFRILYDRYSKPVFTYLVYATPCVHDAEELTQDVFVAVWQKLHQFRGESTLATWIMSIAVSATKMRARRRRPVVVPFDERVAAAKRSSPFCPADLMDLRRAVSMLPPRARTVLVLHELTQHTHEEISQIMGITAGASKAQLNRAKRLLRERITNER